MPPRPAGRRMRTRAARRRVVPVFLLLAAAAVAIALAAALSAAADDPASGANVLDDPQIEAAAQRSLEERAQEEAARNTPSAEAERTASRDRYADLSAGDALQTDRSELPAALNDPAFPPFRPGPDAEVEHYADHDTAAVVKTADQDRVLAESDLPLRGTTDSGDRTPVDLTLHQDGGQFAPQSAPVRTALPTTLADGFELPVDGGSITVHPVADTTTAVQADSDKLLYANAQHDSDLLAATLPTGIELSNVVRAADAPEDFRYAFDGLPDGATLELGPDGQGAEIVDGSRTLAAIAAPTATGADGAPIPVDLAVSSNELVVSVRHHDRDVAYPLVVDPKIETFTWHESTTSTANTDFTGWAYNYVPASGRPAHASGLTAPADHTSPFGLGLFVKTNGNYLDNADEGYYRYTPPGDAYVYRADFNLANWNYSATAMPLCTNAGIFSPARGATEGTFWVDCRNYVNTSWGTCAAGTYPNCDPAAGTAGNDAETDFWAYSDGPRDAFSASGFTGTGAFSYTGDATVYVNDRVKPTINQPPSDWVDATASFSASDSGLGVKTLSASSPTVTSWAGASITTGCTGTRFDWAAGRCVSDKAPQAQQPALTFNTAGLPEGPQTVRASATDAVDNTATPLDYTLRIDRTPPSSLSLAGGTLTGTDNQPLNGSYTLNFSASDQYSGVKVAKLYVDDMTTPVDTRSQTTACGTTGCPGSLSGQFSFDSNAKNADGSYKYSEGTHTIKVTVEDPLASSGAPTANHTTSKTFSVIVDRTEPAIDTAGTLDDAEALDRVADPNTPGLTVAAHDDEGAAASSGVKTVEVKLDGVDSSPGTQRVDQTCSSPGCQLQHDFVLNTSQLGDGEHTADVFATDFAGNVRHEQWSFTIDRTTPRPYCSQVGVDPDVCTPDPTSTALPTCALDPVPSVSDTGTFVSGTTSVNQTMTDTPDLLAASDPTSAESLPVAPTASATDAGYTSGGTLAASVLGKTVPTYTVGAGTDATCVAPTSTTRDQSTPQLVNQAAVDYANAAASTDTILRPSPFGVTDVTKIRDGNAPEQFSYNVNMQPGQYLQQLDSGTVAVIDPNRPRFSADEPPLNQTQDPATADTTTDAEDTPGADTDPVPYTADDLAGDSPASTDAAASDSGAQYDAERRDVDAANQEADGQAATVFVTPSAQDATGAPVAADISVTQPKTITVTIHHVGAGYTYPIIATEKGLSASRHRKHYGDHGLGVQVSAPGALTAAHTDTTSAPGYNRYANGQNIQGEGAPVLRNRLDVKWTRFIMYDQSACEDWDQPHADGTQVDLEGADAPTPPSGDPTDPKYKAAMRRYGHCIEAIHFVHNALTTSARTPSLHLIPYITFKPIASVDDPKLYAQQVNRLWKSKPFDQVKDWGATNEPDLSTPLVKQGPVVAATIYDEMRRIGRKVENGSQHPNCWHCHISAGEFSQDNSLVHTSQTISSHEYIRQYMDWLGGHKPLPIHPPWWAFHDYRDLWQDWPRTYDSKAKRWKTEPFPELQLFKTQLYNHPNLIAKNAKLRITEAGVLLHNRPETTSDSGTPINGRRDLQIRAAWRFRNLNTVWSRTQLVSYWAVFGDAHFDSAIMSPQEGTGNHSLNGTQFRPVYCVLTNRTLQTDYDNLCPATNYVSP